MNFSLTPEGERKYRQAKQIAGPKAKHCKGPCNKHRSDMQFVGDSLLCRQCVLRTPK